MRGLLLSFVIGAAVAACNSQGGAASSSAGPKVAESGTKRGSAAGFSTVVGAELGKQPGIVVTAPGAAAKNESGAVAKAAPTAGSGAVVATANGKPGGKPSTGSASTTTGTTPVPAPAAASGSGSGSGGSGSGSGSGGSGGSGSGSGSGGSGSGSGSGLGPSRPLKTPSADLAAIKFDLEPNWERDTGEAGTFSLVVKVPNTNTSRVFSVRYGYDADDAPTDCDAYKKFLGDKKLLTVSLNRQRGSTCYIEGTDPKGAPVWRTLLSYGGKHLVCTGSLYKDAASLGDLRDKVLLQAKKICETLAL